MDALERISLAVMGLLAVVAMVWMFRVIMANLVRVWAIWDEWLLAARVKKIVHGPGGEIIRRTVIPPR